MKAIVIYKSKYGATKKYARWIAEELGCEAVDVKGLKPEELEPYDSVIYGGGLYAEVIAGAVFITKNFEKLKHKRLILFTTGITPTDCRAYYDNLVLEKNLPPHMRDSIRVYNFPGKMIYKQLTPVHRTAIKTLKKIMAAKENPTEMEKMLISLCDADGDFTDRDAISELIEYAKQG